MMSMGDKLLAMTSDSSAMIWLEHKMQAFTRVTNGQIMMSDYGDTINISFSRGQGIRVSTNQVSDAMLRDIARRFDEIRSNWGEPEPLFVDQRTMQDHIPNAGLWHDASIEAMRNASASLLPKVIKDVAREGLQAAGFLGFHVKSQAVTTKAGISAFSDETDCDFTVTARTLDGKTSGWGGEAARDWSRIDPDRVIGRAVDVCKRSVGAQAVEPGRRTAILTSDAVGQLMRYFGYEFGLMETVTMNNTPFVSKTHPSGYRYGERMFDARLTMSSDPCDPDGGYCPYFWFGFLNAPETWVEKGVLKALAWPPYHAAGAGRTRYSDTPISMRISGGETTIEEMIAKCEEGIFVNRFSDVELLAMKTGQLTGMTRDGCFLVKNGKIDRPIKNLRFLESPFFALNKILALGVPKRAAFGYAPPGWEERVRGFREWPRLPLIVPPLMVQDFNFNAMADAV
jgi:predicted Zn-dependent protease